MSDPYYDQTVLFLPFERPTGVPSAYDVNRVFDFSKYHKVISVSGMPSLPASPIAKYGNYAAYFNSTGDYTNRYIQTADVTDFAFAGDFTIECWVYPFSIGATWGSYLLDTRNTSATVNTGSFLFFGWADSNYANKVTFGTGTTHANLLSNAALTNNTWSHIAVVRSSGVLKMYINGLAQTQTVNYAGSYPASTFNLGVSSNNAGTTGIAGYVDEYRITLAARYTANFTPTQIDLADYPFPAFSPKLVTYYRKSSFDYNSLPKYKAAITHYRKSPFDYNSLPKAKRYIRHEKNSIRDWSALARLGRECVKGSRVRHDFNNATFGSLSISNQGTIAGIIKIYGSPVKRRVRLYESQSGAFVREMWSGDDGAYLFTGLKKELLYTVTSTDYAEQYNDVIGTNISPT